MLKAIIFVSLIVFQVSASAGDFADVKANPISTLDAKNNEDMQKIGSLNFAEFLSQLDDYTPTVSI